MNIFVLLLAFAIGLMIVGAVGMWRERHRKKPSALTVIRARRSARVHPIVLTRPEMRYHDTTDDLPLPAPGVETREFPYKERPFN